MGVSTSREMVDTQSPRIQILQEVGRERCLERRDVISRKEPYCIINVSSSPFYGQTHAKYMVE